MKEGLAWLQSRSGDRRVVRRTYLPLPCIKDEMSTNDSQTQHPTAILQQTLRERLTGLVATLHPSLSADVLQALQAKGKLLAQSPSPGEHASSPTVSGMWPLLTLLVAQAVSPQVDLICASGVAVAVECFVCALDLL